MYHYEQEHGQINEIFLHSELVKTVLSPNQAQRFDVWPLGGLKVPDFLFHTPGNFDNQIAAVEVKTAHLSPDNLINDLIKLTELRQNYRYHLGIFHCVNTNIGRLRALLNESDALAVGLDHDILIECKPGYGQMLQSCMLGELLT